MKLVAASEPLQLKMVVAYEPLQMKTRNFLGKASFMEVEIIGFMELEDAGFEVLICEA